MPCLFVATHSLDMKYPEKRYVQGVRPAHIVFQKFSSPRLKVTDPAQRGVVADAECFPRREDGERWSRQGEVSRYAFFIVIR